MEVIFQKKKAVSASSDQLIPCKRYGKVYFRRSPLHYHDAHSPAQELQRGRMPAVVAFYQSLQDTPVYQIWRIWARQQGCSGYNLFVRENINAFCSGGEISDYSKITLSKGFLQLPDGLFACRTPEGKVKLSWRETEELSYLRKDDRLTVALIDEANPFEVVFPPVGEVRREQLQTMLPSSGTGYGKMHLYLFFSTPDRSVFSNQRYFNL